MYLKYWLGTKGLPLIEKWENTGKLVYEGDAALQIGHKLKTDWTLLEAELQPKAKQDYLHNRVVEQIQTKLHYIEQMDHQGLQYGGPGQLCHGQRYYQG